MGTLIEVKHKGIEGTARVPRKALKTMTGWEPVDQKLAKEVAAERKAAKAEPDTSQEG